MNFIDVGGIQIAYFEAGTGERTLVFLHGNSMSSKIFDTQLGGQLANNYRLLFLDLPGHGASGNAIDPLAIYTLPGYSSIIRQALNKLQIKAPILIGFSLGGNIALEMAASEIELSGLVLIGSSPLSRDPAHVMDGFRQDIDMSLVFQETVNAEEVEAYATLSLQGGSSGIPGFMVEDVKRTDGKARPILLNSLLTGNYADQVAWIKTNSIPLSMIYGENDKIINLDYIRSLSYANLWDDEVKVLSAGGHAPFRDVKKEFDTLIDRIAKSLCIVSP